MQTHKANLPLRYIVFLLQQEFPELQILATVSKQRNNTDWLFYLSIPLADTNANRNLKKKIIGIFLGHQAKLQVDSVGRTITVLNRILKSVSLEKVRSFCFNNKSSHIFSSHERLRFISFTSQRFERRVAKASIKTILISAKLLL